MVLGPVEISRYAHHTDEGNQPRRQGEQYATLTYRSVASRRQARILALREEEQAFASHSKEAQQRKHCSFGEHNGVQK